MAKIVVLAVSTEIVARRSIITSIIARVISLLAGGLKKLVLEACELISELLEDGSLIIWLR